MSIRMSDSDMDLKKIARKQWVFFPWTLSHFCMIRTFWAKITSTRIKEYLNGKQTLQVRDFWRDLGTSSLDTFIYILGVVNLETSHSFAPLRGFVYITKQRSPGCLFSLSFFPTPEGRRSNSCVSDYINSQEFIIWKFLSCHPGGEWDTEN